MASKSDSGNERPTSVFVLLPCQQIPTLNLFAPSISPHFFHLVLFCKQVRFMTEIVFKLVFKRWGRLISGVSKSILYSSGRLVLRLVLLSIVCKRSCKIGFTLKVTSAPLCSSKGKYLQNWIISPKPCSSYAKNCLPFKLCLPSQIRLTLAGATVHAFFLKRHYCKFKPSSKLPCKRWGRENLA